MDEINLQAIFNEVQQYMSNDWKQIAVYCAVLDNMHETKFYADFGRGFIDCFDMGIDTDTLLNIFSNIEKPLMEQREQLPKKKRWSVFTMMVSNTGDVNAKFDYSDIRNRTIEYGMNWEKDVLKIKH